MNNYKSFDVLVKKALSEGDDRIQLNLDVVSEIKSRLTSQKSRHKTIMSRLSNFSGISFRKAEAICCSILFALILSFVFIPPVRAIGEKGIEKIKTMIYDIVKGKDGKYVAVKVPYIEPENRKIMTYEGDGTAVSEDVILKIPKTLAGGYTFSHQNFGLYDSTTGRQFAVPAENRKREGVDKKFNEFVTTFYRKEKSLLVLLISNIDTPFVLNSRHEVIEGDNIKNIPIGIIQATYAEYPGARYSIKEKADHSGGDEDRTKKPEIKLLHTLKWKYNDQYYTVYDSNGDLSFNELKTAAGTVIESMVGDAVD